MERHPKIVVDHDKYKLMYDPSMLTPFHPIHEDIMVLDLTEKHTNLEWVHLGAVTITIVEVGTGIWEFSLDHATNVKYQSTWFQNMDLVLREFNHIYYTNTAQEDVTDPTFLIGRRLQKCLL